MRDKFIKWFFYGAVAGALSVLVAAALLWLTKKPVTLTGLIGRGQLMPACVALKAAAIGDVVYAKNFSRARSLGAAVVALALLGILFTLAVFATAVGVVDSDPWRTTFLSLVLYLAALVIGGAAVYIDGQ